MAGSTVLVVEAERLAEIEAHCEACYPNEALGLLYGATPAQVDRVAVVAPSDQSATSVSIAAQAVISEPQVIGTFHSHPDGPAEPSVADLRQLEEIGLGIITAVVRGTATVSTAWIVVDGKATELTMVEPEAA